MSDLPHIALTCDAVGGVWVYALDLAGGLLAAGHRVTLVVLGPEPAADQRDAAAALPGLGVVVPGLPLDWLAENPTALHRAGEALGRVVREVGADLLHLNSPAFAAGVAWPVPVVGMAHSCVATWWHAVRGTGLPDDFAWRTALVARGYAAVDALLAPSRAFASLTQDLYGFEREPVVIPNGRPSVLRPPGRNRPDLFAFTAGRLWDEGKDVATLDRAAGLTSLPVLAAGPRRGPNGSAISLAHARGLGRLSPDGIARRLSARPIYVSSALYEPFGLSVLEAAGCGCPLVLSDIPTFRELWDGAARFVPARDARALADALDALAASPDERARLGEAASARAAGYTVDRMAAETIALYGRVLAGGRAAAWPSRRMAS